MSTRAARARRPEARPPVAPAPRWLPFAAVAVVLPFLGKGPAIDEEGYLWIARHFDAARPYDWSRVWPPYDADSYAWAHPPLHLAWLAACVRLTDTPWILRAIAGLPWVFLLSWSVARLATRTCERPGLAAALWLASPIVVLGLQDTWMIDLPAVALLTAAMAAYREGIAREVGGGGAWFVASGVLLGLAIETKYSMAVVLPVLALHMALEGPRWGVVAGAAAVVGVVEAPLWAAYGRPHPWEVWVRRGEIASGPIGGRALGVLARAALLVVPLAWVRKRAIVGSGLVLAVAAVAVGPPADASVGTLVALGVLALLGGMLVAGAAAAIAARSGSDDRQDGLLLGGWAIAVVIGIVLVHNYASARYLLPAAAPAALLVARRAGAGRRGAMLASVVIAGVLAVVLAEADRRYVAAGERVAEAAAEVVAAAGSPPGRFAGEWSFRGAMESAGWTRYRADETLAPDTWVVVADNASAGEVDTTRLEPIRRVEAEDSFPVRVVDLSAGVGLYAETLGALPFGLGKGPLEGATLYQVRR